ncbi:FmdE family protein [Thermodesulfobacteriota bacterium]
MNEKYEEIIRFHGHSCPGLAIGYRMSVSALNFLSDKKSKDEELVAIVENKACGVDAVQYITGCTFGKGNLIFKDYGKHVYTFFNRGSKKGVRVVFKHKNITDTLKDDRNKFLDWLLSESEEKIVSIKAVDVMDPETARIIETLTCDYCGEGVMKTRTKFVNNRIACIPCSEKIKNNVPG